MITLRVPDGASGQLAHVVELFNRDLDGLLANLDTKQQHEFWTNLHQFALAETEGRGRNAGLIASEHVNPAVREALEMADEKLEKHLIRMEPRDREQFWQMVHDSTEQQARDTKQPKARHGGSGEPA